MFEEIGKISNSFSAGLGKLLDKLLKILVVKSKALLTSIQAASSKTSKLERKIRLLERENTDLKNTVKNYRDKLSSPETFRLIKNEMMKSTIISQYPKNLEAREMNGKITFDDLMSHVKPKKISLHELAEKWRKGDYDPVERS